MIKRLIFDAPKDQKEFYIVDVGAGEFKWGESVAEFLNQDPEIRKDIQIHVIGVRGERFTESPVIEKGRCKLYRFGAFKVEEIAEQFREQGLDLGNQIDFAISSWCLRHLVDPVGTVGQIYNLLRPQTGTALLDGFRFGVKTDGREASGDLSQLFWDSTVPFIACYAEQFGTLNHYLIRKRDDQPCKIPMKYLGLTTTSDLQVGSGVVTIFKSEKERGALLPRLGYGQISGDQWLYDWTSDHQLLTNRWNKWVPKDFSPS